MIGRAGRAGYGESGESILIFAKSDYQKVTLLLWSPMDEIISQMESNNSNAVNTLILSSIGLNIANTQTKLEEVISKTLLSVQSSRFGHDIKKMTEDIISKLIKSKSIIVDAKAKDQNNSLNVERLSQSSQENNSRKEILLSQKVTITLKPSTKLEVSPVGKSSFKSGIDLNRTKIVYRELQHAQRSLVLTGYFHLLFIVTPFDDRNATIMPDRSVFYNKVSFHFYHQQTS